MSSTGSFTLSCCYLSDSKFSEWNNYQAGTLSHFHTYQNIQSGPNNQAWAQSNQQTDTICTQLSFHVHFTLDQAETFFARAKKLGLASACAGHQLPQGIVQGVNSHIADGKKRHVQRFLRGYTTTAQQRTGASKYQQRGLLTLKAARIRRRRRLSDRASSGTCALIGSAPAALSRRPHCSGRCFGPVLWPRWRRSTRLANR